MPGLTCTPYLCGGFVSSARSAVAGLRTLPEGRTFIPTQVALDPPITKHHLQAAIIDSHSRPSTLQELHRDIVRTVSSYQECGLVTPGVYVLTGLEIEVTTEHVYMYVPFVHRGDHLVSSGLVVPRFKLN